MKERSSSREGARLGFMFFNLFSTEDVLEIDIARKNNRTGKYTEE